MLYWRRMGKTKWSEKIAKEGVLEPTGEKRVLLNNICIEYFTNCRLPSFKNIICNRVLTPLSGIKKITFLISDGPTVNNLHIANFHII